MYLARVELEVASLFKKVGVLYTIATESTGIHPAAYLRSAAFPINVHSDLSLRTYFGDKPRLKTFIHSYFNK